MAQPTRDPTQVDVGDTYVTANDEIWTVTMKGDDKAVLTRKSTGETKTLPLVYMESAEFMAKYTFRWCETSPGTIQTSKGKE